MERYYRIYNIVKGRGLQTGLNSPTLKGVIDSYRDLVSPYIETEDDELTDRDVLTILFYEGYIIQKSENAFEDIFLDNEDTEMVLFIEAVNALDVK